MLLLDFYFHGVKHREYFKDHHIYPWYVIVHHKALVAWWQCLWRNITISSGRSTPTRFKWLLYSDNLSTSSRLSFSPLVCRKKIVGGLIPLDVGTSLKSQFQLLEHLICSATFQNVFGASILNHLTLPTKLSHSHQNVYVRCSQHPQMTFEVQHTKRCIKDISLLRSNEDNP